MKAVAICFSGKELAGKFLRGPGDQVLPGKIVTGVHNLPGLKIGIPVQAEDKLGYGIVMVMDKSQVFICREIPSLPPGIRNTVDFGIPGDGAFFEQPVNVIRPPMVTGDPFAENDVFPGDVVIVNIPAGNFLLDGRSQRLADFLVGVQKEYPVSLGLAYSKIADGLDNAGIFMGINDTAGFFGNGGGFVGAFGVNYNYLVGNSLG